MLTHFDSDVQGPTNVQARRKSSEQHKTAYPAHTDIVEFPDSCIAKKIAQFINNTNWFGTSVTQRVYTQNYTQSYIQEKINLNAKITL